MLEGPLSSVSNRATCLVRLARFAHFLFQLLKNIVRMYVVYACVFSRSHTCVCMCVPGFRCLPQPVSTVFIETKASYWTCCLRIHQAQLGAGKMAQPLKALTALAEDPRSVPGTHPARAHDHLKRQLRGDLLPFSGLPGCYTHKHTGKTLRHVQ